MTYRAADEELKAWPEWMRAVIFVLSSTLSSMSS